MSITCKICNSEFPKIIPYQHLAIHGISTRDYKNIHGPVYSEETKNKLQQRIPHNKGKKVTDRGVLANIRAGISKREEKYSQGELIRPRTGKSWDQEHRTTLSQKNIEYAKNNPEIMHERANRAIQTKIERYGEILGPMTNKKHSEKTKNKLKAIALEKATVQKELTWKKYLEIIEDNNLEILENYQNYYLQLKCRTCDAIFSRTKQIFFPSKKITKICPECRGVPSKSRDELEILNYLRSYNIKAESGKRNLIFPLEVDIFVPDLNLGIEYCGLYWHSELSGGKDQNYHRLKYNLLKEKNIELITIFSDEWKNKKEIVLSKLNSKCRLASQRIFARKCEIREISTNKAKPFLEKNHISGYGNAKIKLGLFFQDELVYVMTFSLGNLSRKQPHWEIQRMAGKLNCTIVGGASKLFSHFIKEYQPEKVIAYSDLKWGNGNVYKSLGFELSHITNPGYWYFQLPEEKRYHRFTLRKNKFDDPQLTEWQNRQNQGFDRIWDCGHSCWVWTAK
jgi:hypothetical protein